MSTNPGCDRPRRGLPEPGLANGGGVSGVLLRASCALLVLGSFACRQVPQTPPPQPPTVGTAKPVRRAVTFYSENTGTTRSVASVEVRARVSGTLEKMSFQPSSAVREGDLLFVIEPRPYKAALDETAAALRSAQANLARAESDLKRISIAIQTQAVSESDLDLAKAQRDQAAAAVLSAEAALDRAELQFSYTEVRAPIGGQVGRNLVDVGNVVSGAEGTILTTINQLQPIFVYFDAPEELVVRALRTAATQPDEMRDEARSVFVATLADEGYPYQGKIDFVSNTVDSSTGTIEVRALLDNEDLTLFPGLFVRVRVPLQTVEDAVLVKERSVGTDLGGRYVYLVGDDNVVEQRYVELGPVQEDGMVPVTKGLDGGETYVVDGLLRVRPGLPVTPETGGAEVAVGDGAD